MVTAKKSSKEREEQSKKNGNITHMINLFPLKKNEKTVIKSNRQNEDNNKIMIEKWIDTENRSWKKLKFSQEMFSNNSILKKHI